MSLPEWALRAFLKVRGILPAQTRMSLREKLIRKAFARDIAEERRKKNHHGVEALEYQRHEELNEVHDDRELWHTDKLRREANKLRVPVPEVKWTKDNDVEPPWYRGRFSGDIYLTPVGYKQLRDAVREERTARRDTRAHRMSWLAAWTGLIGAAAGAIAAYAAVAAVRPRDAQRGEFEGPYVVNRSYPLVLGPSGQVHDPRMPDHTGSYVARESVVTIYWSGESSARWVLRSYGDSLVGVTPSGARLVLHRGTF